MTAARSIAFVTVARSDFGLAEPLLERVRRDAALEMRLLVSGAHFAPQFGPTVAEIEAKGYAFERLDLGPQGDDPASIAVAVGAGVQAFGRAYAAARPDLVVIVGDRIEMLCGAIAAIPFNIPLVHLYGGKISEGATDELTRHALTKMSHLHFVTSEKHAQRVRQMGEESWRVFNFGSPGLDRIRERPRIPRSELCEELRLDPALPFVLVTFHPVTLEPTQRSAQISALLTALARYDGQIVMTYPNADAGHTELITAFTAFAASHAARVRLIKSAGSQRYLDLMANAAVMVGNSSSGIGEAPSFELPVVNIGSRQAGFDRAPNVIDVGYDCDEIAAAVARAVEPGFRRSLQGLKNPYGDGHASPRILEVLRTIPIDDRLLRKKFVDAPPR